MSTIDTSNPLTESEVTELATIITLSHGARVVRYIDGPQLMSDEPPLA